LVRVDVPPGPVLEELELVWVELLVVPWTWDDEREERSRDYEMSAVIYNEYFGVHVFHKSAKIFQ
jgi:hypothetical protein